MSRKTTGNQYEKWAVAWLESQGYVCHRAQSTSMKVGKFFVSRSNDIFHTIDIIAKKKGERTRWIQVTSESVAIGVKAKKMEQVPWDLDYDSVEVWQYHTGRWPEGQYFQVRKLDDSYALHEEERISLSPEFRKEN